MTEQFDMIAFQTKVWEDLEQMGQAAHIRVTPPRVEPIYKAENISSIDELFMESDPISTIIGELWDIRSMFEHLEKMAVETQSYTRQVTSIAFEKGIILSSSSESKTAIDKAVLLFREAKLSIHLEMWRLEKTKKLLIGLPDDKQHTISNDQLLNDLLLLNDDLSCQEKSDEFSQKKMRDEDLSSLEQRRLQAAQRKAKELLARRDILEYLCPTLKVGADDAFTMSNTIAQILVPLAIAGSLSIPLVPTLFASMALLISRIGIANLCKEKQ